MVPVNPMGGMIFSYEAVTSISTIDPPVDLAVIVIRPDAILDAMREAADRGIRNLLILPGGFAEAGPVGPNAQRSTADARGLPLKSVTSVANPIGRLADAPGVFGLGVEDMAEAARPLASYPTLRKSAQREVPSPVTFRDRYHPKA